MRHTHTHTHTHRHFYLKNLALNFNVVAPLALAAPLAVLLFGTGGGTRKGNGQSGSREEARTKGKSGGAAGDRERDAADAEGRATKGEALLFMCPVRC